MSACFFPFRSRLNGGWGPFRGGKGGPFRSIGSFFLPSKLSLVVTNGIFAQLMNIGSPIGNMEGEEPCRSAVFLVCKSRSR